MQYGKMSGGCNAKRTGISQQKVCTIKQNVKITLAINVTAKRNNTEKSQWQIVYFLAEQN